MKLLTRRLGLLSIVATLMALCCGTSIAAEPAKFKITGTVIDSVRSEPIPYATVTLCKDSSSKPINAVAGESDGRFVMPLKEAGQYSITVSYPGSASRQISVAVDAKKPVAELGKILLKQGIEAEAVTVTAAAPLITTDIDKITYNTAVDPESSTQSAIEMMRKVPMLTIDGDDNIQLKGQGNFKVLVNGKTSTMMARNLKEVLRSMPASSIKSVEVITDPPAKYEAEGLAGIINIITTRRTNNGFNGSVGLNSGIRAGLPTYGANAYIAAAIGKFNVSANYYYNQGRSKGSESYSMREYFDDPKYHYMRSLGTSESSNNGQNISLEASYEIDTFNLITLSVGGYIGNYISDGGPLTQFFDEHNNPDPTRQYRYNYHDKSMYAYISGNLDYQRTFQKPDRMFTASYKFDINPNRAENTSLITDVIDYSRPDRLSNVNAVGGEHTFQADYVDPLTEKHLIEAGLKYILRPNTSNTDEYVRASPDVEWSPDNSNVTNLDYFQHIGALYASYQFRPNKKFSIKAGARGEYTINDGTFYRKEEYPLINRYFDLIPYLTFNYKPTDSQNLRLGYTQRLSRPGIWYLMPYVQDLDPFNITTGNPDLISAISHTVNLSYGLYGKIGNLNVSASASVSNNEVEQITTARPNGVLFTTFENIGSSQRYGVYVNGSLNFFERKLSLWLNAGANYSILGAYGPGNIKGNRGWNYNAMINATVKPWKNGSIYLSGGYSSPSITSQGERSGYVYSSIGVGQEMLKKKLRISINASNPFTAMTTYSSTSTGVGFTTYSESTFPLRSFRLSLTWNFGKMDTSVKKARRGISNDDKMSGGGGQSSPQ